MKVLMLTHPEQDYGEFFLFSGLINLLGEDNLIVYPQKLSYMGFADTSYLLHNENKRGMTCPASYVVLKKLRIYPFEEIVDEMSSIDLIVLASPRHYAIHALQFIKQIYGNIPKPLAFVDGEDGDNIREDLIEEFKPQFIFKRELRYPIPNIHPLPFSSCLPYLPYFEELKSMPKTLDVFALFGNTHQIRVDVIQFLLEQNLPNSYIGIDTNALPWQNENRFKIPPLVGYEVYLRKMASAKINIVLRGHGRDTVRYWEAANVNSLMLIKDPGIIIPHPYIDKVHCVYFDELNDLREKIDYYLSHEDERLAIANNCFEHTMKYHTNEKRAEQFLETIKNNL